MNKTNYVGLVKTLLNDSMYPPNVKKILNKYGNNNIKSIEIIRTPLSKLLTSSLNLISTGDFQKKMNDKPYDKLYHLSAVIALDIGKLITVEKMKE